MSDNEESMNPEDHNPGDQLFVDMESHAPAPSSSRLVPTAPMFSGPTPPRIQSTVTRPPIDVKQESHPASSSSFRAVNIRPQVQSQPHPRMGGKGIGKGVVGAKRYNRKLKKDNILAITRGDIRRMARRGGVKRISSAIYDDVRDAMKAFMTSIIKDCVVVTDHLDVKTVTVKSVVWALNRIGRPIYGFGCDESTHARYLSKRHQAPGFG